MDSIIFHNDCTVALEDAHLSPGQIGLLTGWGVFTTLILYHGEPFAFERHWARMIRDAKRIRVPISADREDIQKVVVELARANKRDEGMARVSFVRNTGGPWADAPGHPPTDVLVFTRELTAWPSAHRLMLEPAGIYSTSEFAGTKILSWVEHASAYEKAHVAGFDDALMANEKGQLAECSSANFFLVREGAVLTPPLSSGCLPGITREILLEIAPQAGIKILEQPLTIKDLSSAEEVFITSTTREVAPVEAIGPNWKFPAPGRLTRALSKAFREYAESYLRAQKV
jgi:branched-chain amino acid aminotransferase